jgi:soluble lytic murein transglycosylase
VIALRVVTGLKILVLVALAAWAGYATFSSDWFQKKYLYPFPYQGTVFRYAVEHQLDPFLIAGMIRTESKFIPEARSPKGALGLMQVMPETGQWVAGQLKYPDYSPGVLTDPEVNIRFGVWYLASLKREFQGNEILMLAAYNGGRGNVRQWMGQFGWTAAFAEIEQIPFRETREYVVKVLRDKERYRQLYGR